MKNKTTITLNTEIWKELAKIKLDLGYKSFDSLMIELIKTSKFLKKGEKW